MANDRFDFRFTPTGCALATYDPDGPGGNPPPFYNISYGTSNLGAATDDDQYASRLNDGYYLKVSGTGKNVFDDNVAETFYGDENNDWLLTNNDEGTQKRHLGRADYRH